MQQSCKTAYSSKYFSYKTKPLEDEIGCKRQYLLISFSSDILEGVGTSNPLKMWGGGEIMRNLFLLSQSHPFLNVSLVPPFLYRFQKLNWENHMEDYY